MSFVLVGNYGDDNIGDESLRQFFQTEFRDIDWRIVSARPNTTIETPRFPGGIRSFLTPWWKTILAIWRSQGVVFGGGTLFSDTESLHACFLWASYAVVARLLGRPIFLAYQGVGPFRTRLGAFIARAVYRRAAFISVRDGESLARVNAWNVRTSPVLTFDPAFAYFASHATLDVPRNALLLIPRENSNEAFFTAAATSLEKRWDVVRIILMHPSPREYVVALRLKNMAHKAEIIESVSVDELLLEVARAKHVVSQRYHGSLAALAMKVSVDSIPLTAGDKLAVLREIGQCCDHEHCRADIARGTKALREALFRTSTK